jgi:hypothetical protein
MFKHARYGRGYEVSSHGDRRFSALWARLKDGRTIEEAYQLDVKGYRDTGATHWKAGKGRPPLKAYKGDELYQAYEALWQQWVDENPALIIELRVFATLNNYLLTDKFASTPISQARALASILNKDPSPVG